MIVFVFCFIQIFLWWKFAIFIKKNWIFDRGKDHGTNHATNHAKRHIQRRAKVPANAIYDGVKPMWRSYKLFNKRYIKYEAAFGRPKMGRALRVRAILVHVYASLVEKLLWSSHGFLRCRIWRSREPWHGVVYAFLYDLLHGFYHIFPAVLCFIFLLLCFNCFVFSMFCFII